MPLSIFISMLWIMLLIYIGLTKHFTNFLHQNTIFYDELLHQNTILEAKVEILLSSIYSPICFSKNSSRVFLSGS